MVVTRQVPGLWFPGLGGTRWEGRRTGPLVSGTTLALVMAMAGRTIYCDDLNGDGVSILRNRGTTVRS